MIFFYRAAIIKDMMDIIKPWWVKFKVGVMESMGDSGHLIFGRLLMVLVLLGSTRFFALANAAEFSLLILFLFNASLRKKLFLALKDARLNLYLIFWLYVLISGLWSSSSVQESLIEVLSWRKNNALSFRICVVCFVREWTIFFATCIVLVTIPYLVMSWEAILESLN